MTAGTLGEITASVPTETAHALIMLVGGGREMIGANCFSRWEFPDGFQTWATDEALDYALRSMPDILGDLLVSA